MLDPARELAKARHRAGLSLQALADLAGLHKTQIVRYETGVVAPSAVRWLQLLALCGMRVKLSRPRRRPR